MNRYKNFVFVGSTLFSLGKGNFYITKQLSLSDKGENKNPELKKKKNEVISVFAELVAGKNGVPLYKCF